MRRRTQEVWPGSLGLHIDLRAEDGLAQRWNDRFLSELASVLTLASIGTPEQMYRDVLKAAQRWLGYELTVRKRDGEREPKICAFTVTYFTDENKQGTKLAVIDVLSGRISR